MGSSIIEDKIFRSIYNCIRKYYDASASREIIFSFDASFFCGKFPGVNRNTLEAIFRLFWQRRILLHAHTFKDRSGPASDLLAKFPFNINDRITEVPHSIMEISIRFMMPPCFIIRVVLGEFIRSSNESFDPVALKGWMNAPHTIPNASLSKAALLAIEADEIASPLADAKKQWAVVMLVSKLDLPFIEEQGMRKLGYPKTPDILLPVPIGSAFGNFVSNWIESKALFGDIKTHERYLKNQYLTYYNRYGPGIVIYWFGFTKEILNFTESVMVVDSLPEHITMLTADE
ncbi:hypothetical protein MDAP_000603 [Mitosporidium daphniae]